MIILKSLLGLCVVAIVIAIAYYIFGGVGILVGKYIFPKIWYYKNGVDSFVEYVILGMLTILCIILIAALGYGAQLIVFGGI